MGGGSLEVAEALDDRVGERWVSLPLGALPGPIAAKAGGARPRTASTRSCAKACRPCSPSPSSMPSAAASARLPRPICARAEAPVRVVHGYSVKADVVRAFAKKLWHMAAGQAGAPARRGHRRALDAPRRRHRAGPGDQAPRTRAGRVLGPGPARGLALHPAAEAERYLDPLVEGAQLFGLPLARVPDFALALAGWTDGLFPGELPADRRLRLAVCALSDIAWRDHPDVRAEESFRRLLQFPFIGVDHAERTFVALAIHARYAGGADARLARSSRVPALPQPAPPGDDPRPRAPARLPLLAAASRRSWPAPACTSAPTSSAWRWAAPPACPTARWSATGSGCWRVPSACGGRRSSRRPSHSGPR